MIEHAYDLKETPAAGRFWSAEPLLCDLGYIPPAILPDGVIAGGESGPRPMHPDWVRNLRDQCISAGVDFHFKQWGSWVPLRNYAGGSWPTNSGGCIRLAVDGRRADDGVPMQRVGKKHAGRTLDGVTHDALPWRSAE
jgi:protein gp37